jgi:hypothetical protein
MFASEALYLTSVLVQLLPFRCHVVFHVRRISKCSPRYLTVSAFSTTVWLMYTGGIVLAAELTLCARTWFHLFSVITSGSNFQ